MELRVCVYSNEQSYKHFGREVYKIEGNTGRKLGKAAHK